MGSSPSGIIIRGSPKDLMMGQMVIVVAILAFLTYVVGYYSVNARTVLVLRAVFGTFLVVFLLFWAYLAWDWWRTYVVFFDDRVEVRCHGEGVRSFSLDPGTELDLLCEETTHLTFSAEGGQVEGRDRRIVGIKIEDEACDYLLHVCHGWKRERVVQALDAIPDILRSRGVRAGTHLRHILEGSGAEGLSLGRLCGGEAETWQEMPGQ